VPSLGWNTKKNPKLLDELPRILSENGLSVNQKGSAEEKFRALREKERDGVEGRRGKEKKVKLLVTEKSEPALRAK